MTAWNIASRAVPAAGMARRVIHLGGPACPAIVIGMFAFAFFLR
jgi:hypothetical protein